MCKCPTFLKIEIEFNGYMALARLWNVQYLNEYIDQYIVATIQTRGICFNFKNISFLRFQNTMQYVLHFKMPEMALDSHCVIPRQRGVEEESTYGLQRSKLRQWGFDFGLLFISWIEVVVVFGWLDHLVVLPTHDFLGKV